MYCLYFERNKSRHFPEALSFARELGGSFDGKTVRIEVPEEYLTESYSTFRTLFGIIQNWKGTRATFQGEPVHPYRFVLKMHKVKECALEENCGINWGCKMLTALNHRRKIFPRSWFNIGYFRGSRWVIDKPRIKEILLEESKKKGALFCPLFDETQVLSYVDDLPDFLEPDGTFFEVTYKEIKVNKKDVLVKENVRFVKLERPLKPISIE